MAENVEDKPSAAVRLYQCREILALIVNVCSWSTLVQLGHSDTVLRDIVHRHLRERVKLFVEDFISRPNHQDFFRILDHLDGVIWGAFVRSIMSTDTPLFMRCSPNQLDIVVPAETQTLCQFLRKKEGYKERVEFAQTFRRAESPLCKSYRKFTKDEQSVVIYEVHLDTVIPTLLMSEMTSQMFALTPRKFYCYYPGLFAQKECLHLRPYLNYPLALPFADFNVGLTCLDQDASRCNYACPVFWRNSGLRGVGVCRWGGIDGSHGSTIASFKDFPFSETGYAWRRDEATCGNKACPNYKRSADLLQRTYGMYGMNWENI